MTEIRADNLVVGDVLRTAVGRATVRAVYSSHHGVEVVVGSGKRVKRVLWFWTYQRVKLSKRGPGPVRPLLPRPRPEKDDE